MRSQFFRIFLAANMRGAVYHSQQKGGRFGSRKLLISFHTRSVHRSQFTAQMALIDFLPFLFPFPFFFTALADELLLVVVSLFRFPPACSPPRKSRLFLVFLFFFLLIRGVLPQACTLHSSHLTKLMTSPAIRRNVVFHCFLRINVVNTNCTECPSRSSIRRVRKSCDCNYFVVQE